MVCSDLAFVAELRRRTELALQATAEQPVLDADTPLEVLLDLADAHLAALECLAKAFGALEAPDTVEERGRLAQAVTLLGQALEHT